jgi:hypothetical protein
MKSCMAVPWKRKYKSREDAEAMIRAREGDSPELNAYYCKSCLNWHLTSAKRRSR